MATEVIGTTTELNEIMSKDNEANKKPRTTRRRKAPRKPPGSAATPQQVDVSSASSNGESAIRTEAKSAISRSRRTGSASRRGRSKKANDGSPTVAERAADAEVASTSVTTNPIPVSPTMETTVEKSPFDAVAAPVVESPAAAPIAAAVGDASAPGVEQRRRRSRRGRRRGRRGRGGGESSAASPPSAPSAAVVEVGASIEPDAPAEVAEAVDDELLPLDFDDEGGVELEGATDEEESAAPSAGATTGTRQMIINVSAGTECRIAILHEGRLEEFFIERESTQSHVGNIYKGRVTNVEPSIQAAFIDFGLEKNGFLHISDVQPQYFPNHSGEPEDVGRKIPRHHRPPIQKCFRRGQEVIVQITKEGVGTKGPTLTSYLSIPGRFLVMMPGMSRHGVSRKIEDDAQRREMRDLLGQLSLPKDMGFILRTAGLGRNKRELQRDLNYLMRLWKTVVERIRRHPAPAELYRESDLVTRTIRDVYAADFERIVVDDAEVARKVKEFLQIAMPRTKTVVETYSDREPLFHRYGIEAELERINMRHVPLPSGGSLVIDSTEAMVAIDVNSGRFRSPTDAEETALRINLEAAEEIARQLRLRDLGGLIVCDFIDMRHDRNKRKVEQALRDALKKHKERARILRMSAFGLIEMTRQRQGPSVRRNLYTDCAHCRGTGQVKQPESVMLDAMRLIQLAAHHEQVHRIVLNLSSGVAFRLLNQKRSVLGQIESETGKTIVIQGDPSYTSDQIEIACEDARGRPVSLAVVTPATPISPRRNGR